ncbi:GGDEF domain-containing protein [Candidatus Gracilibacteria bacterium]|nr:GGDEF domain-containing protein [Candidatus Gracilibacteria bacterium]
MQKNTSLEKLLENNEVLSVSSNSISKFARLKNIGQLIELATGQEIEGINNEKLVNNETVTLARYILRKTTEILGYDAWDIRDREIFPLALKLGEELVETKSIENFVIGAYIQKIAYQVKTIHLRYERLNKHKQILELKKDSTRDHLTGLLNRKSMELYLEDAIANKKRNGENFGVIIIDIDFFKSINDTYGHNTGDIVLEEISALFRRFFREEDKICRWGGEEFLLLMKGGNQINYTRKINSLRKEIEKTLVGLVNEKIKSYGCKCREGKDKHDCHCEDEIIQENVTISSGIAVLEKIDTPFEVVKRADEGLYLAKVSGRNKVIFKEFGENKII